LTVSGRQKNKQGNRISNQGPQCQLRFFLQNLDKYASLFYLYLL
jgi:hypothetical protein